MAETDRQVQSPIGEATHLPGVVIAPGSSIAPDSTVTVMQSVATEKVVAPEVSPSTSVSDVADYQDMPRVHQDGGTVSWTASEFIAHHKTAGWYAVLAAVTIVIAGLLSLLTHAIISGVVIAVGGIAMASFAGRKPRQLDYQLDESSLSISGRSYPLSSFRSYAVVPEGALISIIFMPLKRFAPITTVYFAPEDEEQIFTILSVQLPFEDYSHDFIDNLMHRIRF